LYSLNPGESETIIEWYFNLKQKSHTTTPDQTKRLCVCVSDCLATKDKLTGQNFDYLRNHCIPPSKQNKKSSPQTQQYNNNKPDKHNKWNAPNNNIHLHSNSTTIPHNQPQQNTQLKSKIPNHITTPF
jgi:hypothetical protein